MAMDQVIFEGYAPHKVPVIVEVYTDNPNRTAPEMRVLFRKGVLGNAGSNRFLSAAEIDWLVEREDGALLGVEVKAGAAGAEDFRHLRWFGENAAKGPFTGVVLYGGKDVLRFGEGYFAVPLGALGA